MRQNVLQQFISFGKQHHLVSHPATCTNILTRQESQQGTGNLNLYYIIMKKSLFQPKKL